MTDTGCHKGLALTQELREEQEVELPDTFLCIFYIQVSAVAHRYCRLYDHHRIRVYREDEVDYILDAVRVEVVFDGS